MKTFGSWIIYLYILINYINHSKGFAISNDEVEIKIVGGDDANFTPYQVSIRNYNFDHICGGSILNKKWIITAAHCISNDNRIIAVGSIDLTTGGAKYEILAQIPHPKFNDKNLQNDIGLIATRKEIILHRFVQSVKLPSVHVNQDGIRMIVTGWGFITTQGPTPNRLKKLTTYSYNQNKCKQIYSNVGRKVFDTMLCTFMENGKGTCFGDSGGPLVYNNELHGIVCSGYPCGVNYPDIFTRVASYIDWINLHINQ